MLQLAVLLLAMPSHGAVIAVPKSAPTLSVTGIAPLPLNNPSPLPSPLTPSLIPSLSAASTPVPYDAPRSLNTFWDGVPSAAPAFLEPSVVPYAGFADDPLEQDRLAPWLDSGDPKTDLALDRAVALARTTRAGRRALDEAERILNEQGRTLPVKVLALGRNHGEYDYVEKTMRLHKALFQEGREADLAGTIVHELTHVAQHSLGVPSNALEMEIEAHLTDLAMLRELGLEPPPNTFARQLSRALAEGPAQFIALIQAAVPGTVFLGDSSFDEIDEQLESDLDEQNARKSKSAAGLARTIERDLDLLRTKEGRASYKAFSRRVLALLRRRASEL